MRSFDAVESVREIFDRRYIRQNAATAMWLFLSPFCGLWWARGRVYPLFDPFCGGSRFLFGRERRETADRMREAFERVKSKHGPTG